jgi:hypothetical protein
MIMATYNNDALELTNYPYVVWTNYKSEGWSPIACNDWDGVLFEIIKNNGDGWIITIPVVVREPKLDLTNSK